MVPSAGPYYLPRLIGLARAFEMLLTGDPVDAATAERLGLVNRTVPHAQLPEATLELAQRLTKVSPLAARFTKRAVYVGQEADLKSTLDYVTHARAIMSHTEDSKEGVRAFGEKRAPRWTGR
jgi:2-(1,2-epoxy-1,2-dihydrophenyl)acetyl-CoA isomerase